MPQFDKITFFNQVFWLFFFFSGFYFLLLKAFLPRLSFILKARSKKLHKGSSNLAFFLNEQSGVIDSFNSFAEASFSIVKAKAELSFESLNLWENRKISDLNKTFISSSTLLVESAFVFYSLIAALTKQQFSLFKS